VEYWGKTIVTPYVLVVRVSTLLLVVESNNHQIWILWLSPRELKKEVNNASLALHMENQGKNEKLNPQNLLHILQETHGIVSVAIDQVSSWY